jgi:hypothetical protein
MFEAEKALRGDTKEMATAATQRVKSVLTIAKL